MNEKISDLNTKFWDDFPSLYSKNKGTNSYLHKTSSEIEKIQVFDISGRIIYKRNYGHFKRKY